MALPHVISRKDAETIKSAHRDLFEFMPNSGSWITARGLTACQGITTKTVVVKVALHLKDELFELIRKIAADIVAARSSARRSQATA